MDDSPDSTHQAITTEPTGSEDSTDPHSQGHREHQVYQSETTDTYPSSRSDQPRPLVIDDALSYLDAIKANSNAEIYNNFLDIMKDFKHEHIDTLGVFRRTSTLFHGYPELMEGFHTFLPLSFDYSSAVTNNLGWVEVDTSGELEDTIGCHLAEGQRLDPHCTDDTQAGTSTIIHHSPDSEIPSGSGRWEGSTQTQVQVADSVSSSMTRLQLQDVGQGMPDGDNFVGSSTTRQ